MDVKKFFKGKYMKKLTGTLLSVAVCASLASAVQFEAPKDTSSFDKVEVGIHGDLTFSYQALEHSYTTTNLYDSSTNPRGDDQIDLQPGFILPTADLNLNAKIMSGFNIQLQTMLSSHHHHETYVKGGEATIDNLDFVYDGFAKGFMDKATIRVGVKDINFGDAHFRRTNNASVFNNPFVNNLAVESGEDAAFIEVLYRIPSANMFVMGGVTNDQVNPSDVEQTDTSSSTPAMYGKIGYDNQVSDALRVRVTESVLYNGGNGNNSLYHGDKSGVPADSIYGNRSGFGTEWNAMSGYYELTASMTNVFVKYNNTELFGLVEFADSKDVSGVDAKSMVHYSADIVQRFSNDKYYVAARYEKATVDTGVSADEELTQVQATLGWFLSPNAVAKLEYIEQDRKNMSAYATGDASFDGFMLSTALTF